MTQAPASGLIAGVRLVAVWDWPVARWMTRMAMAPLSLFDATDDLIAVTGSDHDGGRHAFLVAGECDVVAGVTADVRCTTYHPTGSLGVVDALDAAGNARADAPPNYQAPTCPGPPGAAGAGGMSGWSSRAVASRGICPRRVPGHIAAPQHACERRMRGAPVRHHR